MKKLSEYPVLAGMCLLTAVSVFAVAKGGRGEEGANRELTQIERLSAEMELSFLRFQANLPEKSTPEETRVAMGHWHRANEDKRNRIEVLRKLAVSENLDEIRAKQNLPEFVPILEGSDPESFQEEAQKYLSDVVAFHQPIGIDLKMEDFIRARAELSKYMEAAEHLQLIEDMKEARELIVKNRPAEIARIPLVGEELEALPENQRWDEQIYAIEHELFREPLKKGEEIRDRWETVDEKLAEIRKKKMKAKMKARNEVFKKRISDLEKILTKEDDENER